MIDLHLTWCGPCIVMSSNYRGLYFNIEEAEKRIEFWTIDTTLLPPEFQAQYQITCKPKFLIYLEGELKGEIDGADYTKIENIVTTYLPSLDD